jgi:hypothetical protein
MGRRRFKQRKDVSSAPRHDVGLSRAREGSAALRLAEPCPSDPQAAAREAEATAQPDKNPRTSSGVRPIPLEHLDRQRAEPHALPEGRSHVVHMADGQDVPAASEDASIAVPAAPAAAHVAEDVAAFEALEAYWEWDVEAFEAARLQHKAMWATWIVLVGGILWNACFLFYHHVIMPSPVKLGEVTELTQPAQPDSQP